MTPFYKLSGGGNDFIALVEPEEEPGAESIRHWCRRGVSLGADGLFILRRGGAGAIMSHFNADGGPSELCVNGTRCAARLAFHLGWADDEVTIATASGPVKARRLETDIALEVPPPGEPEAIEIDVDGQAIAGWRITVGVPHFVIPSGGSLEHAPVAELGPRLRAHRAFAPAGANIDFVRFPTADRMEIRTFERGVEAETLACGSGVLAAAASGLGAGRLQLPAHALTRGGFVFEVDGPAPWRLAGDARLLAHGSLLAPAADSPAEAVWS